MFGYGPKIDVAKISGEVESGEALLLDVRGRDEWSSAHATGALHFPLDSISSGRIPTADKSIKLYLYCASGGRSGMASQILKNKGFQVENIGGLSSWKSAGGKTE
jgi:rhodanese-related sulfurtransferase